MIFGYCNEGDITEDKPDAKPDVYLFQYTKAELPVTDKITAPANFLIGTIGCSLGVPRSLSPRSLNLVDRIMHRSGLPNVILGLKASL